MIDKQKRKTLKRLSASVFASVAVGSATTSSAGISRSGVTDSQESYDQLAHIELHTRVSSKNNDIEIVISNIGSTDSTITHITPSQTVIKRGTFDFTKLLEDGPLKLSSGQSVRVPMKPRAVVLDASTTAPERAQSLTDALRKSFSVITDNDAFARVDLADNVRFG